jgi:AcrR family transcriptional regulator
MPRPYRSSVRAASAAETRRRIVAAAIAVYAREGFNGSIQAVAREADCSPATVLNHFETSDALVAAACEALIAELALPEPAELRAAGELDDRVRRLVRELAICYERTEAWYQVYARDRDMPVLQRASADFFARVDALVRAALGPGLRDKRTVATVLALTGPATIYALRATGMSMRAAADAIADVLIAWLVSR